MESLERCKIILGLSSDNDKKLALVQVFLEKAREDIELFCRDTFLEPVLDEEGHETGETIDVFPQRLKTVQEDLALARYRKREAEGYASQTLGDNSTSFEEYLPDAIKQRLYPYVRLIPRR